MTALTRTDITGWSVAPTSPVPVAIPAGGLPASVPGSVHTDLMDAGLIPDIYLDDNEALYQWVGRATWQFAASLPSVADADRVDLVCLGLDTVATLAIDGEQLASTANMHRTYRFDVTDRTREGARLTIDFASAVSEADASLMALGYRAHVNHHPYNGLRKMACSFGWDWGLDTATCGIWRPIRLEAWSTARLAQVLTPVSFDGTTGVLTVKATIERTRDDALTLSATIAGRTVDVAVPEGATEATLEVRVDDAEVWWPVGHGAQPLYDVTVSLTSGAGELDSVGRRVGFREIGWDATPDTAGTPFTIIVNGRPIVTKGVNWIPDDAFPHRVTKERYRTRLQQTLFSNSNLVRIWGGGIFEDDNFYDLCDEMGLLVWQDFLLACAAYPEEEPLFSEIVAEARDNVARLAHHASLAMFNGNNENLWGKEEWGWDELNDGGTWGAKYYYDVFPNTVAELAPGVAYTPGSPWSPGTEFASRPDTPANDPDHGTMHVWDMWNARPMANYRDYKARFVAEFGWQGPPTWSTLTASVHDNPITPESPQLFVHQKAASGNMKLTHGLLPNLALPREMKTWSWAMQWNQAEAVGLAINWWRSLHPHNMGTVVWQINDCWPVVSWAAVDGYGRAKPLLYALRHAHADRLVTIQPDGDLLRIAVLNDTDEPWSGELVVKRRGYVGEVLAKEVFDLSVAARGSHDVVVHDVAHAGDAASELLEASFAGVRGLWFYDVPRRTALEVPEVDLVVEPTSDGATVTVTAHNLVRAASLLVDQASAD
ncbi:MAG TPA: glycoside hydrolase family 2 protein, partial [Propionibacteriaceae bacterium]|nr:glycoside hydrolase family 2 protein [Propionibacteriaceae bacterium]